MPSTIIRDPTFLRVVLSGAMTHQELQALAHDLAVIEAASVITPHRLTDLSAVTAPHPTFSTCAP